MPLSTSAIAELHWWLKYLKNAKQSLQDILVDSTIQTDASEQGWGADGKRKERKTILMFREKPY